MKKHSEESLQLTPVDSQPSNNLAKPRVRYDGFESIETGRRLKFSVKSNRHGSIEILIEIPDAVFAGVRGISIQDAAPMVYEKIVKLFETQDTIDSKDLRLTDEDVRQYIVRHISSQKRAYSSAGRRGTNIAA